MSTAPALSSIPRATYRLQLHRGFTFVDAMRIVPYLEKLGISHVYCSPYLKARAGSTHGYDIVNHQMLNPEIGTVDDLKRFAAALRNAGMGQILDIVPNHMGVGGGDNPWWLDVLENGQASAYAAHFDIDWQPAKFELSGKVLLPVLEDQYGTVLENGLLTLHFDPERGEFCIHYHEHRFPIDPASYGRILCHHLEWLEQEVGNDSPQWVAFRNLIADFDLLPPHTSVEPDDCARRRYDQADHKQKLSALYATEQAIRKHIDEAVARFNGLPGDPVSFDRLHELLEQQPYRPAYWRVAADEINYRRFFDINALAGLRVENRTVFEETHELILQLVSDGTVNGLRIDHPDGLYDPARYYRHLHAAVAAVRPGSTPLYVIAEKILAIDEQLPNNWQVHGTTGYEFANLVNGLFVHPDGQRPLTRLYAHILGTGQPFGEILYDRKKLMMRTRLSGELMVLANLLDRISEVDRHTRDYTLHTLRETLMEFIACLPVYRTYLTTDGLSEQDRQYVTMVLREIHRRSPASDMRVFDFLEQVLLLRAGVDAPTHRAMVHFIMKLQQYCAPVMAKGFEDTSLYIYNRLASLNEVGGDPRRFGVTLDDFHRTNRERMSSWPHSLLATSTHDTKRSEDVRARLNLLSELPASWRARVNRWRRLNRGKKQLLDGTLAPSANDEYLLYQTLFGTWPLKPLDEDGLMQYRERIEAYAIKAAREAKTQTSWIAPNSEYERVLTGFIRGLLKRLGGNRFLNDFQPFVHQVSRYGLLNGLSQTLLKLTAPGVPDIYQGCDLWDFSLVDPDNRRPVDYTHRQDLLDSLEALPGGAPEQLAARVHGLLDSLDDGRAKLYVIWRTLALRRTDPALFAEGRYEPLEVTGARAGHLCAFARTHNARSALVLAPRWYSRLMGETDRAPPASAWGDTRVAILTGPGSYTNIFTGESFSSEEHDGRHWLNVGPMLATFPVAVLSRS